MKLTLVALTAAAVLVSGCDGQAVRGPFRNQYVDATTEQPIPGVVFLVEWYTGTLNPVDGGGEQFYEAREAVSGADGRVEIPGLDWWAWRPTLDVRFYEFVPGYVGQRVDVDPSSGRPYRNPTRTVMRRLSSRAERCEVANRSSAVPSKVTVGPPGKFERYMSVLDRERDALACGALERR